MNFKQAQIAGLAIAAAFCFVARLVVALDNRPSPWTWIWGVGAGIFFCLTVWKFVALLRKAPQVAGTPSQDPMAFLGLPRPLVYAFQFSVLPEAAFQNHPELIRELEGDRTSPLPLLQFWSKAFIRCVGEGLLQPPAKESDPVLGNDTALLSAVSVQAHKAGGYTVHVITMPTPQSPPEVYFSAIVFKDDEPKNHMQESPSTRYFTLEKSLGPTAVLCETLRDGKRRNFGAGPAPEATTFAKAVFERIAAAQPESGRVALEGGFRALMMFAPRSTADYHLVCVNFEDGTQLKDAKVYQRNELELPPAFVGKKIKTLVLNSQQP